MNLITIPSKPVNDLSKRLMPTSLVKKLKEDESKSLAHFVEMLEWMLSLDPARRPSPKELLNHAFIRG